MSSGVGPFCQLCPEHIGTKKKTGETPLPKAHQKSKSMLAKKIENLHLIIKSCKQVISKKENFFTSLLQMDLAETTNEVQDPNLILKSFSVTKEAFQEKVDILKGLSFKKFYGILEHHLDEHEHWVLDYASHNE